MDGGDSNSGCLRIEIAGMLLICRCSLKAHRSSRVKRVVHKKVLKRHGVNILKKKQIIFINFFLKPSPASVFPLSFWRKQLHYSARYKITKRGNVNTPRCTLRASQYGFSLSISTLMFSYLAALFGFPQSVTAAIVIAIHTCF